jgi:hypothetical protein
MGEVWIPGWVLDPGSEVWIPGYEGWILDLRSGFRVSRVDSWVGSCILLQDRVF